MEKIKYWDFRGGPEIDIEPNAEKEIETLLKDPTKTEDAGFELEKQIEGLVNGGRENVHVKSKFPRTYVRGFSQHASFACLKSAVSL